MRPFGREREAVVSAAALCVAARRTYAEQVCCSLPTWSKGFPRRAVFFAVEIATEARDRTSGAVYVEMGADSEFWTRGSVRSESGGRTWIRTREGVSQQIYSLPSLAT